MPQYEIRSATMDDAYEIMRDPSFLTAAELGGMGLTPWQALKCVREWLDPRTSDALYENGRPVALFGHNAHKHFPKVRLTWFICRQRFWELGPRGVILCRKYLQSQQVRWPGTTFQSFSRSSHPDVARWFTLLGYEMKVENDGTVCFNLKPKSGDRNPVAC